MSSDIFSFKHFTIHQKTAAMRLTIDSCILGACTNHSSPGLICDIGTGTGVLSLMMAQKYNSAKIDAIEIDLSSYNQACENVNNSPWSNRIRIYNMDINGFQEKYPYKYDLIICNPPYYINQLKKADNRSNRARHSTHFTVFQLMDISSKLLKDSGMLYFILPYQNYDEAMNYAMSKGLNINDLIHIKSTKNASIKRFIAGMSITYEKKKQSTCIIRTGDGNYTKQFQSLLKDFYLGF